MVRAFAHRRYRDTVSEPQAFAYPGSARLDAMTTAVGDGPPENSVDWPTAERERRVQNAWEMSRLWAAATA